MTDFLKYLGMGLTGLVGILGIFLDTHIGEGANRSLTNAGLITVTILAVSLTITLISAVISDRIKKRNEDQADAKIVNLSDQLDKANDALQHAKDERTALLEQTLTKVDSVQLKFHLKFGAWEIKGLEKYEAKFPRCSVVPPDSIERFKSGFAVIDTEGTMRTQALDLFSKEYDLRQFIGPIHISFVHSRNKQLFDKNDHARQQHKSFYVLSPLVENIDASVREINYEQSAANPYYLDINIKAKLVPDETQGFRSAKDFDGAEIKVVYQHVDVDSERFPRPPKGSLAPTSVRFDIRSEHYILKFSPDFSKEEEKDTTERWVAYGIVPPRTFFHSTAAESD